MKRFPGELVFKAHRLVYLSTLGLRVIKQKKNLQDDADADHLARLLVLPRPLAHVRLRESQTCYKVRLRARHRLRGKRTKQITRHTYACARDIEKGYECHIHRNRLRGTPAKDRLRGTRTPARETPQQVTRYTRQSARRHTYACVQGGEDLFINSQTRLLRQ